MLYHSALMLGILAEKKNLPGKKGGHLNLAASSFKKWKYPQKKLTILFFKHINIGRKIQCVNLHNIFLVLCGEWKAVSKKEKRKTNWGGKNLWQLAVFTLAFFCVLSMLDWIFLDFLLFYKHKIYRCLFFPHLSLYSLRHK